MRAMNILLACICFACSVYCCRAAAFRLYDSFEAKRNEEIGNKKDMAISILYVVSSLVLSATANRLLQGHL